MTNFCLSIIEEYNKAKFKDNYLIPYARYLEGKLRDLLVEKIIKQWELEVKLET